MCTMFLYCFAVWRQVCFSAVLNDLNPLCLERGEGFLMVRYTMDAFPGLDQSVGSCSSPKSLWDKFMSNNNGWETRYKLIKWDSGKKKKGLEMGCEHALESTSLSSTRTITEVHTDSLFLRAVKGSNSRALGGKEQLLLQGTEQTNYAIASIHPMCSVLSQVMEGLQLVRSLSI